MNLSIEDRIAADEYPIPEAQKEDINIEKVKEFFDPDTVINEALLLKSRILVKDEAQKVVPSVGGLLLFSSSTKKYFPNAIIDCVLFRGEEQDSHDQVDARRIEDSLFTQIDESLVFVLKNMSVSAIKTPYRVETPQFSRFLSRSS
ncbi:MAG: hypothetical protein V4591_04370 [Bdellovibrionota bacterium]